MASTAAKDRRTVHYNSLSEIPADAETLASGRYETVGNWSFGQILWHLSAKFNASFDGFPFQSPWLLRFLVRTFMKTRFLTKPLPPGFKLPKYAAAIVSADDVSTEEALLQLQSAIGRFESETPTAPHPALGALTEDEWAQLHLRHAELHMSFVRPAKMRPA